MAYTTLTPRWQALILATIAFARISTAEISSCDAVNCPLDKYNQSQCVIGNSTASAIGIISVNSSLSTPQPLTWTLSVQLVTDHDDAFERDFFLGTPPSLKLQQPTPSPKEACSLFFEGVAPRLRFPGTSPEYDQGTCNDALTLSCVNDLRTQAHDELNKILSDDKRNKTDTTTTCDILVDALRNNAPSSCPVAVDGKWGDVLARPLTGTNASQPVIQGSCYPTTERDYSLTLVAANRVNSTSRNTKDISAVLFGITPIMTVVYGDAVTDIEVDLACLKTVGPKNQTTMKKDSGGASVSGSGRRALLLSATIWLGLALGAVLVDFA